MGRIISGRGIIYQDLDNFIDPKLRHTCPDPFHLLDMIKAVEAIAALIITNETIGIFGDYDVDGATSTALLCRYLRAVGAKVVHYIPDREKEGYGPNIKAFQHLVSKGAKLIITVDCGTLAHETLAQAHQEKIPVIVVDHHISTQELPQTLAIINPNRLDESSKHKNLAAVGVCFLLLIALNKDLRTRQDKPLPNLLEMLDLVALGTVCDVVELTGFNRSMVAQGLKIISMRQNIGIKALCEVAGVNLHKPLSTYHLGFVLGPRINAGGRVGQSSLGVELLTCEDYDKALKIAQQLDFYNQKRKEIEQNTLETAQSQLKVIGKSIVVQGNNWHQGVIGIIAGRLKEKYHRPVAVITMGENGEGKASCRSIKGVNIGSNHP